MKHCGTLILLIVLPLLAAQAQTPFEMSQGKETATYQEAIDHYKVLAARHPEAELITGSPTDVGKALHLFLLSGQKVFDPKEAKKSGLPFILINNAIHPGEPCGVDASMMLARDLLEDPTLRPLLDKMIIGIIPLYNIGGALNRGCCSRANQEGPLMHGFRGNARNYDLNRDFIKMDTRNAAAFIRFFQTWLPDVFIDTHTTNGADYQATLTLIATRPEKLRPALSSLQKEEMLPALQAHMDSTDYHMCPYVYCVADVPDKGIAGFMDLPRYSSGYAALFQTLSFITEAHMLKPFADRVEATYDFLEGMLRYLQVNGREIHQQVIKAREEAAYSTAYAVDWKLDRQSQEDLLFKGFEYTYEQSQLTGGQRLKYHRDRPFEKTIPYYNTFEPSTLITKPKAYILPQAYVEVVEKLKVNGVKMAPLYKDTALDVEAYYLEKVHTQDRSYEGHYFHDSVELRKEVQKLDFYEGDWVIPTDQLHGPYVVHCLEPLAADALFRWNAFDGVLMQKEYFSSYVFEDHALEILEENPSLKAEVEAKKAGDPDFRENPSAQLSYIYTHSVHYEKTHRRYPVFRWKNDAPLPVSDYLND